ncbi:hypothetical protein EDB83DRAFT_2322214 [Lactarius deliciosus]|nr:hypothetical protein EDB83DRAFT_2322214 [Lactarius deliciosus]
MPGHDGTKNWNNWTLRSTSNSSIFYIVIEVVVVRVGAAVTGFVVVGVAVFGVAIVGVVAVVGVAVVVAFVASPLSSSLGSLCWGRCHWGRLAVVIVASRLRSSRSRRCCRRCRRTVFIAIVVVVAAVFVASPWPLLVFAIVALPSELVGVGVIRGVVEYTVEEYSGSGTVETARRVPLSDGIGVVTVGIARDRVRVILAVIKVQEDGVHDSAKEGTHLYIAATPLTGAVCPQHTLRCTAHPSHHHVVKTGLCACRTYLEDTGVATHKGLLPQNKNKNETYDVLTARRHSTTPTIDVVSTKVIAPGGLHSTSLPPPLGAEVSSTHPRNDAVAGRSASNDGGKVAGMTARRPW